MERRERKKGEREKREMRRWVRVRDEDKKKKSWVGKGILKVCCFMSPYIILSVGNCSAVSCHLENGLKTQRTKLVIMLCD